MNVIYFASMFAILMLGACAWILKRITGITNAHSTGEDLNTWIEISQQSSKPIERLLDPAEFDFLRRRGMSKQRIEELRAKRRELFRMYLRRLTHEFNGVNAALREAMVSASVDRGDLGRELARQRILFYKYLLGVEIRLTANAMGFAIAPSLDLIRPLERLHLEFLNLVPAAEGAQA